jgi:putative hydrolase of HD superfamily
VKDLDKFEMIQQAFEYETNYGVDLSEFYKCVPNLKTQEIKAWAEELLQLRNKFASNKKK